MHYWLITTLAMFRYAHTDAQTKLAKNNMPPATLQWVEAQKFGQNFVLHSYLMLNTHQRILVHFYP